LSDLNSLVELQYYKKTTSTGSFFFFFFLIHQVHLSHLRAFLDFVAIFHLTYSILAPPLCSTEGLPWDLLLSLLYGKVSLIQSAVITPSMWSVCLSHTE
jgi:hypothetical protein